MVFRADEMPHIHFRTTLVVRDPPAANADFFEVALGGPHAATVRFEKSESDLILLTRILVDVSERRFAALTELAANRLPEGYDLSRTTNPFIHVVDADGSFPSDRVAPIDVLPQTLIDLFDDASRELHGNARNVFAMLRWLSRSPTRSQPFASRGTEWSLDAGETWMQAPSRYSVRMGGRSGLLFRPDVARAIALKLAAGQREPLGHELFNEAYEQRDDNLRSAFIVTMMALEVRVKELIIRRLPDTRWLVEHLPSPPVEAILREYLPALGLPAPSDEILRQVKKYVMIRNEVIHRGREVTFDEVDDALDLVEDLLLMLDYLDGETWPWPFIGDEVRATLTPPPTLKLRQ